MVKKCENGNGRTRNFATIVYPESAPQDWLDILEQTFVPCFVSPLHDKDKNQKAEDEMKKPHYHLVVMFDSVKTNEQAKELFDKIGGVGCERVASLRGYARYLIHLDNPEKHRYNAEDIRQLGGADWHKTIATTNDKYTAVREMCQFCIESGITSYSELFEYAMLNREDWFRVLCDSATVVIKEYLKSKAWTAARGVH